MPREYDFKAFDGKSVHVYVWDEVSKPLVWCRFATEWRSTL